MLSENLMWPMLGIVFKNMCFRSVLFSANGLGRAQNAVKLPDVDSAAKVRILLRPASTSYTSHM